MPESSLEEIRTSTLRYLRMYEEGSFTLRDLACELAVMAPAYDHAMGGIADSYGELLAAAYEFRSQSAQNPFFSGDELEQAMTNFRRSEAAW
jgi:acyl transferase domain-containing protein